MWFDLGIIQGKGDGTIAADNVDVNVNIAFCLVLKAALRVVDSGYLTYDQNYNVTVTAGTSKSDPAVIAVARASGQDIISAYHRLLVVINKIHLDSNSNSMIGNINNDVKDLFSSLNQEIPGTGLSTDTDYYLSGTY